MIRRLKEADREAVLAFLYEEPELNLYIIGDIYNYGFDGDDQCVYGEFDGDDYVAVMSRNLSHIVYYAKDERFNPEWVDVIKQFDHLFISGKAPLMQAMHPYFKDMIVDRLMFMKSTTFKRDETVDYEGIRILETIDDATRVYDLLNRVEELDSVRKKSKDEFIRYLIENSGENGTTVYLEDEEEVVASASAVGETKLSAMIVGVASHPEKRGQGYGKKVLHYLMDYYVNHKQKTLCLYYDDPTAGALYKKLGFKQIDDWIMLLKDHD